MTTKVTLLILLIFLFGNLQAQTIEELYDKRDFKEIVKYADKSDELSEFELYCVGYAFFQIENDKKAIEKGMDDDAIYLYKGLSLRYDKQNANRIRRADISVLLVNLAGTKVEKKILTEKTSAEIDGTKHLLCGLDKATGTHYTYPIGWKSDEIDYRKLREYVILIFDGEIEPQAFSNFSGDESPRESKKKKKRKKNK